VNLKSKNYNIISFELLYKKINIFKLYFQKLNNYENKQEIFLTNEYNDLLILRAIKEDVSQPSIAKDIGFSVGKVNFILKALVQKGLVKYERFHNSNNKMKYRYLLTEDGITEKMVLTQKFIARKKAEYEELQKELEADTAKWGGKF
jgi:EPS-associated MarR family transcriptional regulator